MQEDSCRALCNMGGFSYSDDLKSDMDEIIALISAIENYKDKGLPSAQEFCPLREDTEEKPLSFSLDSENKNDFTIKRVVEP